MKIFRKISAVLLAVLLILTAIPVFAFAEESFVAAEWQFSQDSVKSGSIDSDDLVFADKSGNGNDLRLDGKHAGKYLRFSNDRMYEGTSGSLALDNKQQRILGSGVEFITADNAPINKESFKNGYTIELIYKLPDSFAADDSWMGLMARKGRSNTNTETSGCTMSLAVSNCKELQYVTVPADDNFEMDSAWSIAMDKGGLWYHLVIVSDGKSVRTFVNGCESFRDNEDPEMAGIFADPKDGRFVIGGYDNGLKNHYGRGSLQQVRISKKALDRSQWLISDHENYIEKFGENLPFTNLSKSSYNVVFLPDIQNAAEFRPEVLQTAAGWLNRSKELVNAAAIISLGDSINSYDDQAQWDSALSFYNELEKGNYNILQQPGNHDYGDSYYLDTFGPESDFGKRQSERGVVYSPEGYSSYMMFDGGSYRYLVISLSYAHIFKKSEQEWFESVLQQYGDCPTIVTSHSFQDVDAAKPSEVKLNDRGKTVWKIAKKYNQVFMMISGHNHGAGEEVLLNDSGNDVYSIMADYQFSYNGGNAFFKFAEFDEAHGKIRLSTFSPYAATLNDEDRSFFDVNYMTGDGNYTVIDFDFVSRFNGLRKSSNEEEFRKVLQNAAETEKDAPVSLFENAKTVSRADAHKVSTFVWTTGWIVTAAVAAVLVVAAIITVPIVCVKRKRRSKNVKEITA